MQFWIKFFNQPMMWGLAFVMILAIGLWVYKTPGLLMLEGGKNLFGIWVEAEGSYADSDTTPNNQGFVADVLTNYPTLSGVSLSARDANGELMSQTNAHYNFWVGLFVTIMLFVLVVIATRKSTSAIFILGPLLVGLIILMVVTVKSAGNMGYPDAKISLDVGGAIFDWLLWYGGVSLGVFFAIKAMIRNGLIRGIDEEGPLDFSRLQHVLATTAGKTVESASAVGHKLQRAIGETDPVNVTSVSAPQPAVVAKKPLPSFRHRHCVQCGGDIKNGKCSLCSTLINGITIDIAYGLCDRCDAPKAARSKFCYNCGVLFDDETSHSYSDLSKYCSQCGQPQASDSKYCEHCGAQFAAPQN
ncbi:MAG: zinc ribbon domain-containing protein [Patescibacteria group bacterium]